MQIDYWWDRRWQDPIVIIAATTESQNRKPDPDLLFVVGFCFGGRCALMFAAHSREIDAVAPFYGNLRTPAFANRKQDPLDVLAQIRVPVQGHYSDNDAEISPEQLHTLEQTLRKQGTPVEIFTYKAQHGFFSYQRKTYDQSAAETSWQRTAEFFKRTLAK